jgi:nuclear autoantigenic sperm protein
VFFLRYFPYITPRNVSICLIFELASNIGDAVAYCAKAISFCKSRVSNLKNGNEALLLDNGDNAPAAEAGSERSALSYELEFLTGMSCKLEKKVSKARFCSFYQLSFPHEPKK